MNDFRETGLFSQLSLPDGQQRHCDSGKKRRLRGERREKAGGRGGSEKQETKIFLLLNGGRWTREQKGEKRVQTGQVVDWAEELFVYACVCMCVFLSPLFPPVCAVSRIVLSFWTAGNVHCARYTIRVVCSVQTRGKRRMPRFRH